MLSRRSLLAVLLFVAFAAEASLTGGKVVFTSYKPGEAQRIRVAGTDGYEHEPLDQDRRHVRGAETAAKARNVSRFGATVPRARTGKTQLYVKVPGSAAAPVKITSGLYDARHPHGRRTGSTLRTSRAT